MRLAVVGNGVDLSYHEAAANAALAGLGLKFQFLALDVPKGEFDECVRHLIESGFRGAYVAHPYKVDAARIATRFWVAKYPLGVANALLFEKGIFAQNTEYPAVTRLVRDVPPTTALVMGTGHAARSVLAGLLEAGFKTRIWNRNANKTKVLHSLLSRFGDIEVMPNPDPSGCKLVVNATPLGAKLGECPPLMWNRVLPKTVLLDLVFRRVPTDFIRTGINLGLRAIDGRELLVEQAAIALEWWTNKQVPREPMRLAVGLKPRIPA